MKYYKGFNSDMTCRGYQFEEGKSYEEQTADLCKSGFHACEDAIDILGYYPPVSENGQINKYHEVELEDVSAQTDDDSKRVGRKITIGAELNFFSIAKAHIEYVKSKCEKENNKHLDSGYYSVASNSGYYSVASNSGYYSVASNSGNQSVASNSGHQSVASNSGYQSVAVAWGKNSKAKGAKGSYLVLTEWGEWNGNEYPLLGAKLVKVTGKKIKADTYYMLKDGKVQEC